MAEPLTGSQRLTARRAASHRSAAISAESVVFRYRSTALSAPHATLPRPRPGHVQPKGCPAYLPRTRRFDGRSARGPEQLEHSLLDRALGGEGAGPGVAEVFQGR